MFSSAIVLIPARNESASVGAVIREIKSRYSVPVILIDDASTDNTADVASKAGATVLSLSVRLGAWGAIQAGMRYALAKRCEYVITIDADGQHEAENMEQVYKPVREGKADIGIGACVSRGSLLRKIAWAFLKRVSGLSMEDITSGFRVYNEKAMKLLADRNATLLEYQDIGVLTLLCENGLVISETQVDMKERRAGQSRVFSSWVMVAYYMLHSTVLGFSKRRSLSCNVLKDVE
jgi:glycosyltransferase involved in cell wall biosynthesis